MLTARRGILPFTCRPSHDKRWSGEHQRPFQEIAFHLIRSGEEADRDELCAYLTISAASMSASAPVRSLK